MYFYLQTHETTLTRTNIVRLLHNRFPLNSLCPKGQKKPILIPFVNKLDGWKYTQTDLKIQMGLRISYYLSSIGYETCSSKKPVHQVKLN